MEEEMKIVGLIFMDLLRQQRASPPIWFILFFSFLVYIMIDWGFLVMQMKSKMV